MITSKANAHVKQIRALRQRKERERDGLFFVEGIRITGEAAQLGARLESIVFAPELLKSAFAHTLVQEQQRRGVACLELSAEVFESLSAKEGPQGIGAVVRQRWEPLEAVQPLSELCWVALEAAQDPGNIGAILRTSDAVGGAGLILLDHSADPYDPEAVRASMGAVFAQRLVRATFDEFAAWKARDRAPYRVIGASGDAPHDYQAVAYQPPQVLLMGSERQGLLADQQAACDLLVKIPMVGRSDSLNLAVAASVVLYEMFNQGRSTGSKE
ncbi:MAG: RNA methyltransferase [Chloroflexi bacterium]|nr:RNA methyltransferase [Chloroflexota bacterium]